MSDIKVLDSSNNIDSRINITTSLIFQTCFDGISVIFSVTYFEMALEFKAYAILQSSLHCVVNIAYLNKTKQTLSSLEGESQVNVFHLLVEIELLPFYKHGFLKPYLVLSGCRVQDLEAIRCAGCSTKL